MSEELAITMEPGPVAESLQGGPLSPQTWTLFATIAKYVAPTEFVPPGLRGKPASVMAALLYGHDLGLGPMVALREITMIDGKPALSAALVTARVRQAGHRMEWRQLLADDGEFIGVTAYGERTDGSKGEYTFTLKMAQRAGLMRANGPYFKYPESMCWARAATQLARMLFSDVFLGHATYAPEELGGEIEDADVVMEIEGSAGEPQAGFLPVSASGLSTPESPSPADTPGEASSRAPGGFEPPVSGDAVTSPASLGSPYAQPASVPLDPRNSPLVLFTDQRSTQARTLKKLDVTVSKGRDDGLFDMLSVHATAQALAPDVIGPAADYTDDAGDVRYSLLRKAIPLWVASQMIDQLEALAEFGRLAS